MSTSVDYYEDLGHHIVWQVLPASGAMARADIHRWWSARGFKAPNERTVDGVLGILIRAGRITIVDDYITRVEPAR